MRIEAYNQVAQIYSTNKTTATKPADKVKATAKDSVQLSSFGKDIQVAKQAVAEASDIREDKVAEVKSKINSGSYNVDTEDFASVLLNAYNNKL